MTYRSLLVPLDNTAACGARIDAALGLAQRMDAHVTGVAATDPDFLTAARTGGSVTTLGELGRDVLLERAANAALRFEVACKVAEIGTYETYVEEAGPGPAFVRHLHYHDLSILSQSDPALPGHASRQRVVEEVILASARPVLVLPYATDARTVGEIVLVAWDDSRESTRAIADALPFLKQAKQVHLIAWERNGRPDAHTLTRGIEAMGEWLERHGARAHARVESTEIGVADALLSRASDLGADLIVMGAYGHSRLAERALGGVSRGILSTMTVPVLLSH